MPILPNIHEMWTSNTSNLTFIELLVSDFTWRYEILAHFGPTGSVYETKI